MTPELRIAAEKIIAGEMAHSSLEERFAHALIEALDEVNDLVNMVDIVDANVRRFERERARNARLAAVADAAENVEKNDPGSSVPMRVLRRRLAALQPGDRDT